MTHATRPARDLRDIVPIEPEIPPLENGDHLTREEFERRYDAMPELKKAELIEGVVYMGSPVGHRKHGRPHFHVSKWLGAYLQETPGVDAGDNSSIRLDIDNMPQPDAFLYIEPECGGQVRFSEDDYLEAAPELIVEVASTSASYNLHSKFNVYLRNGVQEYVVWRTRQRQVDWFVRAGDRFETLSLGEDGIYRSAVLPGLWLDPVALMTDDRTRMIEVNRLGTEAPEHAAFVERLRLTATPKPPGA